VREKPELTHEDDESLRSEQIRSAHEDRSRSRRKLSKKREKQAVKTQTETDTLDLKEATVITAEGAHFILRLADDSEIKAKSYKSTRTANPNSTLVAVGDAVRVSVQPDEDTIIEEVLPRRTKLARKAAGRGDTFEQVIVANVDLLVIVASVLEPPLRSGIIDRYIVAALEGGLSILIAINKIDLASEEEMEEVLYYRDVYEEIGYPVLAVSASQGVGIDQLRAHITGKTSVFAGHSGVGKSSVVNALFGYEIGKTGRLSKKYKRGAHTTTASVVLPLEGVPNTFIVDTPGVREFANYELDTHNLKFSFVEFLPYQSQCAITNCSHIHEPGCAVRQAVEDDKISIERYSSYEKLFQEAKKAEQQRLYH